MENARRSAQENEGDECEVSRGVVRNRYLTRATRREARRDASIIVRPAAALTGRRGWSAGRTRPRSRRRPPWTAALSCDPPMLRHHRRRGRDPHKNVQRKRRGSRVSSPSKIASRVSSPARIEFVHIISEGARCPGGARVVGGRGMHRCCWKKSEPRSSARYIADPDTMGSISISGYRANGFLTMNGM